MVTAGGNSGSRKTDPEQRTEAETRREKEKGTDYFWLFDNSILASEPREVAIGFQELIVCSKSQPSVRTGLLSRCNDHTCPRYRHLVTNISIATFSSVSPIVLGFDCDWWLRLYRSWMTDLNKCSRWPSQTWSVWRSCSSLVIASQRNALI